MLGQVSPIRCALLIGAVLLSAGVRAEIYKSVGADGNVVFSQKPPLGVHAEIVKPRYAKRPSKPVVRDATVDGATAPGTPAADNPALPTELTPAQKAIKADNCANARSQLLQLNSPRANRLRYLNENKELVFYSEHDRAARIKETEKAAKQYCE